MSELVLQDVTPAGVQAALIKMARIVDPVCGIVRSVMPNWLETGDPLIFAFGAVACEASPLSRRPQIVHSGGAATQRDQAIAATIGEAVERYCAAYSDRDELVFAAYDELKTDAIHPARFCLYSKRQYETVGFPFKPFTPKAKVTWTPAFSLRERKRVLVPASLTYLPLYSDDFDRETEIGGYTSTGLACGNTLEEAILSGIAEVVERDALTCFWMNRLPATSVVIDDASSIFDTFRDRFAVPGLQYYTCDIMTDLGVPAFLTLLIGGSNDGLMVNAGSQAGLSPNKAVLKSLVEAAHGRPYVRYILHNQANWEYVPDFSSVNSFQDHAAFYTRAPQHLGALDFIRNPVSTKKLSEMHDMSTGRVMSDIEVHLEQLAKHGLDVIVKDLTAPDIDGIGLKVVRVLIPGLQLLHGDHRYPFLGCPRLFRMRRALGFGEGAVAEEDLNCFPHPLP